MRKRPEPDPVSMTPMIDIVFQMIIFFVCTVDLDKEKFQEDIHVSFTPNTPEVVEPDPQTLYIQIRTDGHFMLGASIVGDAVLTGILRNSVAQHGQHFPVVIHADGKVKHDSVARLLDIVAKTGLYDISFSGIVTEGTAKDK